MLSDWNTSYVIWVNYIFFIFITWIYLLFNLVTVQWLPSSKPLSESIILNVVHSLMPNKAKFSKYALPFQYYLLHKKGTQEVRTQVNNIHKATWRVISIHVFDHVITNIHLRVKQLLYTILSTHFVNSKPRIVTAFKKS